MERNAVPAGRGSLINIDQIKVLICYILSMVNEPVDIKKIANIFNMEEVANYFEVVCAADELVQTNNIAYGEDKNTVVVLPLGRQSAKELEMLLPYTIKNKAYRLTTKMLSRMRNARETKCEYTNENGCNYLTCSAEDNGKTVMSVKIMVGDFNQAKSVEERFLDNPGGIYSDIIDILTGTFAKRKEKEEI